MGIAENIKYLRKKKNMTQKQLADKAGLATITIQQYEAGKYEPKKDSLYKLRKALDCNINEILREPYEVDDISWDELELITGGVFVQKSLPDDVKAKIKQSFLKPLQEETTFLNYLLSLGYKYVDTFYDNEEEYDRCLHIVKENIDIPLTAEEYEELKSSVINDTELEIYRLRKNKGL